MGEWGGEGVRGGERRISLKLVLGRALSNSKLDHLHFMNLAGPA